MDNEFTFDVIGAGGSSSGAESGGDGMLAGLAAAGVGGAASLWSSHKQAKAQKTANAQNYMMALQQMQFQERMANTAHQREVEDLRRAGLNPILSANHGASSPAGSFAQMGAVAEGIDPNAVTGAFSAATQRKLADMKEKALAKELDIMDEEVKSKKADQALKWAQSLESAAREHLYTDQRLVLAPDVITAGYDKDFLGSSFGRDAYYLNKGVSSALGIGRAGVDLLKGIKDFRRSGTSVERILYDRKGRRNGGFYEIRDN